ncbi:MAG TPA: hypothetical protein DD438_13750 [Verrucomicrobiales bacterium]|nr:hypothetical protein [Verrucomicrobiales bacterium]
MNTRIGLAFVTSLLAPLSAITAGDGVSAAKDALSPSAKDAFPPSAKDAFPPSAKDAFPPSAKDAFPPSAKQVIQPSPKSSKDIVPVPTQSSLGRWTIGAGVSWRNIGEIGFRTGISDFTIPGLFQPSSIPVPGIGPAEGPADRIYDNGFVRPDARATRTTDYGYNELGQIQGDTLSFTASGGENQEVTRSSSATQTEWNEDADRVSAPYLKLSYQSDLGSGWTAGPSINVSFAEINGSRRGLNTISAREQMDTFDITATDIYDVSGLDLPREVPYTGAPNIVAPLIPNQPVAGSRLFTPTLRTSDLALWNDTIDETLDLDTWSLAFGAEASYRFDNRFYASLGAGFALNAASWKATRSNQLLQQINNGDPVVIDSSSADNIGSSILWGFYLQASAGYQLNESWSLEVNLRHDHTEDLSGSVGGSSFDVDLSGFSAGLGLGYSF